MLLKEDDILFNYVFEDKQDALKTVGQIMVEKNYVEPSYIKSMIKRDKVASVAIGNGLAIAHSESKGLKFIKNPGMVLIKLAKPLQWDDEEVLFVVGLALPGANQIETLASLAITFSDYEQVKVLFNQRNSAQEILKFFAINGSE